MFSISSEFKFTGTQHGTLIADVDAYTFFGLMELISQGEE